MAEHQGEPSHEVSQDTPRSVLAPSIDNEEVVETERKKPRLDEPSHVSPSPLLDQPMSSDAGGVVRSRVSQIEMDRLEREAVRELRRLERLDRQQAALGRRATTSSIQLDGFVEPSLSDQSAMSFFSLQPSGDSFVAKPMKSKNSEFDMKSASPEEIAGFQLSDAEEWRSILEDFKAVSVLSPSESSSVRRKTPERIVTSRMVRRKKPTPRSRRLEI